MPGVYLDSCIVIYLHEGTSDVQTAIRNCLLPESGGRSADIVIEILP